MFLFVPKESDRNESMLSLLARHHVHALCVGETGSGKTTLGRLISRIESAQQGEVALNGVAIDEIATDSLRQIHFTLTMPCQIDITR